MRTGKYVFDSDDMCLYTLRDKFSCNAVDVVYQITCAGCKQCYIGETQDFRQRMNLHKSDVRTLNTDCLADLHTNWYLNRNILRFRIFIACPFITVVLFLNSGLNIRTISVGSLNQN